jgi:molybdopterin-guanine dinucleotide biosynthesis protein A
LDISFIVLAGGKSIRLGRDKVNELLGDKSLLQWVVTRISHFDTDVIIVTAKKEPVPVNISYARVLTTGDIFPDRGSLGGIYSGIMTSKSQYNFVVGCDMPFLNLDLMKFMMDIAPGFDLVLPRMGKIVEPLHAIYARSCLVYMENLLKQGELQILKFFHQVKVRYVDPPEIERFDPGYLSFFNVNTEEDLKKAKEILAKGDSSCAKR